MIPRPPNKTEKQGTVIKHERLRGGWNTEPALEKEDKELNSQH
jgi:hypothetical protein